jgi:hypothetical protein
MMRLLLLFSALLVTTVGCGQVAREIPDTGATLEGSITLNGNPIPLALIIVRSQSATSDSVVREEGKYKVLSAPLGLVKIGVDTDSMRGEVVSRSMAVAYKGPDGKAADTQVSKLKFVPVPAKYSDPDTSGLEFEVKKGVNIFDIVLTK